MVVDFALFLVVLTFLTGVIWALDAWVFRPRRLSAAGAGAMAGTAGATTPAVKEPIVVEYARSFFPVILLVLVIRSFLYEPFRIPSDSMMPTLLDGDFIFVNKFAYGLRLPVANTRVVSIGDPQRGDVVVFRKPSDPGTNYIKRLVGLPGDTVEVRDKRVYVNGKVMSVSIEGMYRGHNHDGALLGREQLDAVDHQLLFIPGKDSREGVYQVPQGHYFFMGDNRDNSLDSRFEGVGFVPENHLVGKAVRIWFNWDGPSGPIWARIGSAIR
jgi:signal peptidase I